MNRAWWVLPGVALNLLMLLAFDAHAPWLVAIAMLLGLAVRSFFKPSLRESLAGKLTKAQHLRHVAQMQVGLQRLYKKRSDKCPTGLLQAFYEMELWGSAQRELQRLLSLPGCKMLDENLWQVKILLGAGHYKAAFAKMETASESERARFQPYLALAYARTGRQDEAFRMAQSLARSKDRDTRRRLGDIYAALGLSDVALVCYERLAQYSQDAWAFHAAGMMLKALGEYREAGFMFTQALLAAPYMRTQDLLELSTCCWHLGQERDAMEAEMLAKEPQPQKSDMPQPLG